MIYRASHHFFLYNFFRLYSVWKTKHCFHRVYLDCQYTEKGLPVLLISNHFSWWDGFWAVWLNEKVFHRLFWFMMLEEQLKKNMFLNKAGGYSVRKGTRSVAETINYTADLLSDSGNLVLIFPQGEISSMHTREFIFERGVGHIISRCGNPVHIVFVANLIDYFSSPKPGLYMYVQEYTGEDLSVKGLQDEYNRFFTKCLSENLKLKDV